MSDEFTYITCQECVGLLTKYYTLHKPLSTTDKMKLRLHTEQCQPCGVHLKEIRRSRWGD